VTLSSSPRLVRLGAHIKDSKPNHGCCGASPQIGSTMREIDVVAKSTSLKYSGVALVCFYIPEDVGQCNSYGKGITAN
jgi:hypothetical protein